MCVCVCVWGCVGVFLFVSSFFIGCVWVCVCVCGGVCVCVFF